MVERVCPVAELLYVVLFFFSSRRRHTRLQGDWSSDVCSSDLSHPTAHRLGALDQRGGIGTPHLVLLGGGCRRDALLQRHALRPEESPQSKQQIGRASCRERG